VTQEMLGGAGRNSPKFESTTGPFRNSVHL